MSNRLTKAELDAVITAAFDIDPTETFTDDDNAYEAYGRGMQKLLRQLARQKKSGNA